MAEKKNLSETLPHVPLLIVISGPSGIGKDAAARRLLERDHPFHFVVTATSRSIRSGEQHGIDYFFVTAAEFEQMIANDELIEYSMVYEQYKGIPKAQVRAALDSGKDVIMRLDVQGAAKVRKLCPEAILIFLAPENDEAWLHRLSGRKTEDEHNLRVRMETARSEMEHIGEFDYVIVNVEGKLEETVDTLMAIVTAEHHKVHPRKITL